MAIEFVQSASRVHTGVNGTTLAFTLPVTAGNLLVVTQASFKSGGHTIQAPTDTLLHTYVPMDTQQSVFNVRLQSFYVENCTGGANTVTFDFAEVGNGEFAVAIGEFRTVATSSAIDDTSQGGGTGTAVSTGDVTPIVDGCLLYAAMTSGANNVGLTEEAGWELMEEQIPAASVAMAVIYKIQTTATTEDADWTAASSVSWIAHVAVFKPFVEAAAAVASGGSSRTNRGHLGKGRHRGFLHRNWSR